jgi:hypothetical protein
MENLTETQNPENIMDPEDMEDLDDLEEYEDLEEQNPEDNKPRKITLATFGPWIEEKCGAEYMNRDERVDCVASINHIEPGSFAALYVMESNDNLEVFELTDYYPNRQEAWEALQHNADSYPPEIFEDWVKQEYITDKNARVERLEL